MKNLILIPFLFVALMAQAQLSDDTFMVISANTGVNFTQFSKRNTGSMGTSSSINVEVPINRYFSVGAGVGVSNYGQQFNFTETLITDSESPNYGSYFYQRSTYNLRYFSVPVTAKFRYKKFHAFITAQPEFARGGTEVLDATTSFEKRFEGVASMPISDMSEFNLSSTVGFGFSQSVNDFLSFYVEPTVSYLAFPVYDNVKADASQLIYGLKVGVQMELKRGGFTTAY